jgi:hypothetical protein
VDASDGAMLHAPGVPRSAIVAFAVVVSALLGAPAAGAVVTVGIADQRAGTFHDARLTDLVHNARLSVAWDALRYDWQRREIDVWMKAARAVGVEPLVTFGRSRTRKFRLPPRDEYRREVLRFRHRYPDVREYSPWNEPNLAINPRNYDPARIASYYHVLRRMCPACTVLGADVVDTSSLDRWMRAYLREFPRDRRPRHWGLHNYVDVNSDSSWGTRVMRRLAPGEIWFTETGAIVRRSKPTRTSDNDRRLTIKIGRSRAVEATKRVFRLARTSPRITRVYIYHWKATRSGSWDSALVAPDGELRPSFDVFAEQARLGMAREAAPES